MKLRLILPELHLPLAPRTEFLNGHVVVAGMALTPTFPTSSAERNPPFDFYRTYL